VVRIVAGHEDTHYFLTTTSNIPRVSASVAPPASAKGTDTVAPCASTGPASSIASLDPVRDCDILSRPLAAADNSGRSQRIRRADLLGLLLVGHGRAGHPWAGEIGAAARGARHMGRCDRTTTKTRGLNRQRGKGAVHLGCRAICGRRCGPRSRPAASASRPRCGRPGCRVRA